EKLPLGTISAVFVPNGVDISPLGTSGRFPVKPGMTDAGCPVEPGMTGAVEPGMTDAVVPGMTGAASSLPA
ncbi:MAG: hypothetical protein IKX71_08880, partial [Bacteroidales bacterium]|nr:hypothetical protein [Bacteroidales bacterium]